MIIVSKIRSLRLVLHGLLGWSCWKEAKWTHSFSLGPLKSETEKEERREARERMGVYFLGPIRWFNKVLAIKPDLLVQSLEPCGGRRDLTLTSCPLSSTCAAWHTRPTPNTKYILEVLVYIMML